MRRAAAVPLLAAIALVLGSCGGPARRTSPGPSVLYSPLPPAVVPSSLPPCDLPTPVPDPAWLPGDLPLPEGTYTTQDLTAGEAQQAVFAVRGRLESLAQFLLDRWPPAGYELGASDAEPGEFDVQVTKGTTRLAVRANGYLCDPGYVLMLIIHVPGGA